VVTFADGVTLELELAVCDSVAEGVDVPELVPVSEDEALLVSDEEAVTLLEGDEVCDELIEAEPLMLALWLEDDVCVTELVRVAVTVTVPVIVCSGGGSDARCGVHRRQAARDWRNSKQ
jgi:hypothetical protein